MRVPPCSILHPVCVTCRILTRSLCRGMRGISDSTAQRWIGYSHLAPTRENPSGRRRKAGSEDSVPDSKSDIPPLRLAADLISLAQTPLGASHASAPLARRWHAVQSMEYGVQEDRIPGDSAPHGMEIAMLAQPRVRIVWRTDFMPENEAPLQLACL